MEYQVTLEGYEKLYDKYSKLNVEYGNYKKMTEQTLKLYKDKNLILEKKLDSISNIVEISRYINSNISNDELIPMINDMIIGILGVTYSSIYLREEEKLVLKATNIENESLNFHQEEYAYAIEKGEPFVINCNNSNSCNRAKLTNMHSAIGVPVVLGNKYIGYIIVEHSFQEFFTSDHIKFMTAISNQIAIALENSLLYKKVKEASITDPLMKIYNRGHFFELLQSKICSNPSKEFAIVMVDADNFKKTNDVYGHQFGDEALIQLARIISSNIDKNDIVARYGGEELIIYIDNVEDRNKVFEKVDNIRENISNNVMYYNNLEVRVTASFGISYYDEYYNDLREVLRLADTMLYKAKDSGKNMVLSV